MPPCQLCIVGATTWVAADNPSAPAAAPVKDFWSHDRWLVELTSGDSARIAQPLKEMESRAQKTSPYKWRPTPLFVLLDAKMYDQADALAMRLMLYDPFHLINPKTPFWLQKLAETQNRHNLALLPRFYTAAVGSACHGQQQQPAKPKTSRARISFLRQYLALCHVFRVAPKAKVLGIVSPEFHHRRAFGTTANA